MGIKETELKIETMDKMPTMKLKIERINKDIKLPIKTNPTDSGFDVYADNFKMYYQNHGSNFERCIKGDDLNDFIRDNEITLACNDRVLIGLGFKATVGPGYEIQVRPRSGLALKQGLTVLNSPGTIDADYKDECGVILINLSRQTQIVKLGDRVAQFVIAKVELPEIEVVDSLGGEDRGGGFGHSGIK